MGRPFCFCGSANINVLSTLIISLVKEHLIFMTEIPYTDDFVQKKSLCLATTYGTWPVTIRFCKHRAIHLEYRTTVEYTSLVVGLCKLWTTFCVNFEPPRCTCKILVYTAASALKLLGNGFHFEFEEKKSVDFCLMTLISKIICCLKLVFAALKGSLKTQFLL